MLGDVLTPPASTRPKYGIDVEPEPPAPGSPIKKALMVGLLALSSGLLWMLPTGGNDSFALDANVLGRGETDGATDSASLREPIDDSVLGQSSSDGSQPSVSEGVTEVAGQTGVVSEEDTARLALATEAALVGSDPALIGGATARSVAAEMASAEDALAAVSPVATTTPPPTTAAPRASNSTTAPTTSAVATSITETGEAASAETAGTEPSNPGSTPETTATPPATETTGTASTVTETTLQETTTPETTVSETTVPETTNPETTAPETTTPETTVPETTTPETTVPETTGPEGWVDTGNGVLVPPVLLAIRWCESRDDYLAANPSSSARGAYQFLTGSWKAYGHKERYGVNQAHLATPVQQDEAALITWERDGTRPWNASKSCWSKRI